MRNLALGYYQAGYGCSQCILKAAEKKYGMHIDANVYNMAGALNAGIGVGGMCSVLIASVMVLGFLLGEETAKIYRITFLTEFHKKYGGIDCSRLTEKRRLGMRCEALVSDAADILDKVIVSAKER